MTAAELVSFGWTAGQIEQALFLGKLRTRQIVKRGIYWFEFTPAPGQTLSSARAAASAALGTPCGNTGVSGSASSPLSISERSERVAS